MKLELENGKFLLNFRRLLHNNLAKTPQKRDINRFAGHTSVQVRASNMHFCPMRLRLMRFCPNSFFGIFLGLQTDWKPVPFASGSAQQPFERSLSHFGHALLGLGEFGIQRPHLFRPGKL
jgi:hypothetical protein